jgi:hypothetical protein
VDAEADATSHRGEDNNNNNHNSYNNDFIDVRDVLRSLQEAARETAKSEGTLQSEEKIYECLTNHLTNLTQYKNIRCLPVTAFKSPSSNNNTELWGDIFCQIEYTIPFHSRVKVYREQQQHGVVGRHILPDRVYDTFSFES